MKRIACIDTVYSVIDSFNKQLREGIPGDFLIHTMYDDFLATDPAPGQSGKFTPINHQRLRLDMQAQALTGADIIVVTCSTLSPSVRLLRGEFNVPVVAIDDAMVNEAVEITKHYESQEVVSFVNGILGTFVRTEFADTPAKPEKTEG